MTVTDEMLMAYVDGELGAKEAAAIAIAAAGNDALAARIARHRLLAGAVKGAYADIVTDPVPQRLTAAVEAGKVVSLDAARQRRITPSWGRWGTVAAGIAAGLVVGLNLPRGDAPLVGGDMRATGQLASALDSQLASDPPKDGLVRVGLSFRTRDRNLCRTFTVTKGDGPAGLACKDGDGWTVRMAVPGTAAAQGGEYRTAAADTPPEVLAAAQAMMLGDPLDAAGEAAAKAQGWR